MTPQERIHEAELQVDNGAQLHALANAAIAIAQLLQINIADTYAAGVLAGTDTRPHTMARLHRLPPRTPTRRLLMTDLAPMEVERIEYVAPYGGRCNSPVPALDQEWSEVDKLRWLASLVEYSTGLRVRINDSHAVSGPGYDYRFPEWFGITAGRSSFSGGDYDRTWRSLTDIEHGAMAMRRHLGLEEHNPPRQITCVLELPADQLLSRKGLQCDCPMDPYHRWNCAATPIWAQTIRELDTNPWTVITGGKSLPTGVNE